MASGERISPKTFADLEKIYAQTPCITGKGKYVSFQLCRFPINSTEPDSDGHVRFSIATHEQEIGAESGTKRYGIVRDDGEVSELDSKVYGHLEESPKAELSIEDILRVVDVTLGNMRPCERYLIYPDLPLSLAR